MIEIHLGAALVLALGLFALGAAVGAILEAKERAPFDVRGQGRGWGRVKPPPTNRFTGAANAR